MHKAIRRGMLVAAMALTLLCTGLVGSALAAGTATFSAPSPAAGSVVATAYPSFRVHAVDTTGVAAGSLTINGAVVGYTYLDYPIGHWDGDGCDTWWVVDDARVADLICIVQSPGIAIGPATAIASVTNASSVTTTYTWSFTVDQRPVISAVSPADGGWTQSLTPTITATVIDDDSSFASLMTVDGTVVLPTYDLATKTYSYKQTLPFAEASDHIAALTVTDPAGLSATRSWTFRSSVAAPIGFSAKSPAPSATVNASATVVSVSAKDAVYPMDPADAYSAISLDGAPLTTYRQNLGYWTGDGCSTWWVLLDPNQLDMSTDSIKLGDGVHTVNVRARDTQSLTASSTWTFTIASPPVADQLLPARGTMTQTPLISAHVVDNGPGAPTVTMQIDGTSVGSSFNPGTGIVNYTPVAPLSDATTHTISLLMTDASGNATTTSWPIRVQTSSAATWSSKTPAPGAPTPSAAPYISVIATSPVQLLSNTARITLDGVALRTGASQPNTTTVNLGANTPSPQIDGTHTVTASITDIYGITSETNWSFAIKALPTIGGLTPGAFATVIFPKPAIGFTMSDNTPGSLAVKMSVDSSKVIDAKLPQGAVSWTPSTGFVNNSTHSVTATVTDDAGDVSVRTWTFQVVAAPPMSNVNDCTACHTTYPAAHPMNNCTACHGYGEYHGVGPAPTPAGACLGCHDTNHGYTYLSNFACADCHNTSWPTVPRHNDASMTAGHTTTTTGCEQCHSTSLLTEHGKYPTNSPFKMQCTDCHTSTNPAVKSAIASKRTDCEACHPNAGTHAAVHNSTFTDPSCARCHDSNLMTEHVGNRGFTCATCHYAGFGTPAASPAAAFSLAAPGFTKDVPLTAPSAEGSATGGTIALAYVSPVDLGAAINSGDTHCAACHEPMPHGIRTDCTTCHGSVPLTTDSTQPTATVFAGFYTDWTSAGANADTNSPHKGYTTSTVKCSVCHAVHQASPSGQLLLRGTVEGACDYCHISTSLGGIVVYGGQTINYYGIPDDFAHFRTSQSACVNCHSVHGATTLAGANASKILWDWRASGRSTYSTEALSTWPNPATIADKDSQITAWCTGCHGFYTPSYEATITSQVFDHQTDYTWKSSPFKSHIMTDLAGGFTDPASTLAPGTTVAWSSAAYCRSCHDAGHTDQGPGVHADSFPHYTQGFFGFMTVGDSAASSGTANIDGRRDGMCLKCHSNGTGAGVGDSF